MSHGISSPVATVSTRAPRGWLGRARGRSCRAARSRIRTAGTCLARQRRSSSSDDGVVVVAGLAQPPVGVDVVHEHVAAGRQAAEGRTDPRGSRCSRRRSRPRCPRGCPAGPVAPRPQRLVYTGSRRRAGQRAGRHPRSGRPGRSRSCGPRPPRRRRRRGAARSARSRAGASAGGRGSARSAAAPCDGPPRPDRRR